MSEGRNQKWIASRTLALILGFALVLLGSASISLAQSQSSAKVAAKATAPAAQKAASAEFADKGLNTGIKVHGHWVIEVRNPNGTLVRHVEFENSLQLAGQEMLPGFLGRTITPGAWAIFLSSDLSTVTGPCSGGATGSPVVADQSVVTLYGACEMAETAGFYSKSPGCALSGGGVLSNATCFTGLKLQVIQTGTETVSGPGGSAPFPVYGLQLSGTATIPESTPANAYINNVGTALTYCVNSNGVNNGFITGFPSAVVDPQTCATTLVGGSESQLSSNPNLPNIVTMASADLGGLPSPIGVSAGQTVSATVVLNFQ